jgi:hypothetical protein
VLDLFWFWGLRPRCLFYIFRNAKFFLDFLVYIDLSFFSSFFSPFFVNDVKDKVKRQNAIYLFVKASLVTCSRGILQCMIVWNFI